MAYWRRTYPVRGPVRGPAGAGPDPGAGPAGAGPGGGPGTGPGTWCGAVAKKLNGGDYRDLIKHIAADLATHPKRKGISKQKTPDTLVEARVVFL